MTYLTSQENHKRSWRNLLLDARYQLRFTLFMVAVSAVLMSVLGAWVLEKAGQTTKVARIALDMITEQKQPAFELDGDFAGLATFRAHQEARKRVVEAGHTRIRVVLVTSSVLLCLGLFLYGIKLTHRVAGPLHKVAKVLDAVQCGRFGPISGLRKGDQLVRFYEHFREAHDALRARQAADAARLKAIIASLEAERPARAPALAERLEELRRLQAAKEASLG